MSTSLSKAPYLTFCGLLTNSSNVWTPSSCLDPSVARSAGLTREVQETNVQMAWRRPLCLMVSPMLANGAGELVRVVLCSMSGTVDKLLLFLERSAAYTVTFAGVDLSYSFQIGLGTIFGVGSMDERGRGLGSPYILGNRRR